MLVDHANAELLRRARRTDLDFAFIEQDLALIQGLIADQALHQRALAGTVFAKQGMHRTGRDAQ